MESEPVVLIPRRTLAEWIRSHDCTTTYIAVVVTIVLVVTTLNFLSGKGL
jgi:hypothetical protein